ncbi:MAG: hypothetical protein AT718_06375 [Vulcanisaeta sp. JCHS_4]|jgi:hypothetical protein|nr:MAG: hypothetical protein AT718_06375 [Vulcanisaeta sp. JCHS_4]
MPNWRALLDPWNLLGVVIPSALVVVDVFWFIGAAWVLSVLSVLVFVWVVFSVVKFLRDVWFEGRASLHDLVVVGDLVYMLSAFYVLFFFLGGAALFGWALFSRVVLPRFWSPWFIVVGLLLIFVALMFIMRLLRLVRERW